MHLFRYFFYNQCLQPEYSYHDFVHTVVLSLNHWNILTIFVQQHNKDIIRSVLSVAFPCERNLAVLHKGKNWNLLPRDYRCCSLASWQWQKLKEQFGFYSLIFNIKVTSPNCLMEFFKITKTWLFARLKKLFFIDF